MTGESILKTRFYDTNIPYPTKWCEPYYTQESYNPFIVPYHKCIPKGYYPQFAFPTHRTELSRAIENFIQPGLSSRGVNQTRPGPTKELIYAKTTDYHVIIGCKNPFGSTAIMTPIMVAIFTEAIGRRNLGDDRADLDVPGFRPWSQMGARIGWTEFYKTAWRKNLLIFPLLQTFFDRYHLKSGQTKMMYTTFETDLKDYVAMAEAAFTRRAEIVFQYHRTVLQEQIQQEMELKEKGEWDMEEREVKERNQPIPAPNSHNPLSTISNQGQRYARQEAEKGLVSEKQNKHVRFNDQLQIFKFQKDRDSSTSTEKEMMPLNVERSALKPKEEKSLNVNISISNKSSSNNSLNIIVVSAAIIVIGVLGFIYVKFYR